MDAFRRFEVIGAITLSAERVMTIEEILAVLEDGAALKELGFTDEDQEDIEETHHYLSLLLKSEQN